MDLASSFDTCGWFARDMDVFARAGAVLLGEDSAPCRAAAHLVASDVLALLEPRVQEFAQVLDRLAGVIGTPQPVKVATPSFDTLYWAFRHIQGYEAWQAHGENIRRTISSSARAWPNALPGRPPSRQQMQQHSAVRALPRRFRACWARMACCCCPARRMWRRC
jgi:amidase